MANDIQVTGHAAVFNSRSEDLGGFVEIIAPGAFADSLASGDNVYLLHSHDVSRPLASTRSGSLKLREDARGLRFDARLIDSGTGGEVGRLVRRGDVNSMSFGFMVERASDEEFKRDGDTLVRIIKRARLMEISSVSFPAYKAARITARSLDSEPAPPKRDTTQRRRQLMQRRQTAAEVALERSKPTPRPQSDTARRLRQDRMQRTLQSRSR